MRTSRLLTFPPILLTAVLSGAASAADNTDLPPMLRADVEVGYSGNYETTSLEEDGLLVGRRNILAHDMWFKAQVGLYHGIALTVALPGSIDTTISYPSAYEMVFDPVTGTGSYRTAQPLQTDPTVGGNGLYGFWFGVAVSPTQASWARSLPVNTRLGFAARTPAATLYSDKRGVAPGGWGLRFEGDFSVPHKNAEPYMSVRLNYDLDATTDIVYDEGPDASGVVAIEDADLSLGASLFTRIGGEIIAARSEKEAITKVDVHMALDYFSHSDRGSGFYLPDVLDASRTTIVTRGDYVRIAGGVGLIQEINRYLGIRVGTQVGYSLPHRVENVYPVRTGPDQIDVTWYARLVGRVRLAGDPR